jgi:hypothetical protein
MILTMMLLFSIPEIFQPVSGFTELDMTATPTRFGLLLVASEDSITNEEASDVVLAAVDSLPEEAAADLFIILPGSSGFGEIRALCCDYPSLPAVMVLVGHCGYIQLDPDYLETEILDSWYTWGNPDTRKTGICNFCRRCNP